MLQKRWMRATASLLAALLVFSSACLMPSSEQAAAVAREANLQEGDVLFQSCYGDLPRLIEGVTESPYSHCGVVLRRKNGELAVLEAIEPVKISPLINWIRSGRGGRITVCRLKSPFRKHIPEWLRACKTYLGRPYDARYRLDEEKIYCSELLFKGWRAATSEDLGKLVKLRELNWQPYKKAIEELEGGPVPLDRKIITPRDLARAPQLEEIYSNYR